MPPLQALLLLLPFFSPSTRHASFFSLYAKSQHPLFRPKKRRLLPCSTCVPSSGNAEQLGECEAAPRVSVYRTHCHSNHIHDSSALRNKQWSNILVHAVKKDGPIFSFFRLLSPVLFLKLMDTLMCHRAVKWVTL